MAHEMFDGKMIVSVSSRWQTHGDVMKLRLKRLELARDLNCDPQW